MPAGQAGLVSEDNGLPGASGDAPLTGLPWSPKQLERMRLRYSCRATCLCATATPDARWISGPIRSSR